MKVALLSESPADEAALQVLVGAVLAESFALVRPGLRARGWPNVAQVLPAILRHLHFNTEAEALVVVVDSDDSVVHTEKHEAPGYFHPQCRLCQLRGIFHRTQRRFPALAGGRDRVLRGVGVRVPAIEAWYLCGQDPQVTELAWMDGQALGRAPYTRRDLQVARVRHGPAGPGLRDPAGGGMRAPASARSAPARDGFPEWIWHPGARSPRLEADWARGRLNRRGLGHPIGRAQSPRLKGRVHFRHNFALQTPHGLTPELFALAGLSAGGADPGGFE